MKILLRTASGDPINSCSNDVYRVDHSMSREARGNPATRKAILEEILGPSKIEKDITTLEELRSILDVYGDCVIRLNANHDGLDIMIYDDYIE